MEASAIISAADFQSVMDALTAQIGVETIVGVLAVAVTACVGMVFMWWGIRKVAQVIMSAFRNGTVSL